VHAHRRPITLINLKPYGTLSLYGGGLSSFVVDNHLLYGFYCTYGLPMADGVG